MSAECPDLWSGDEGNLFYKIVFVPSLLRPLARKIHFYKNNTAVKKIQIHNRNGKKKTLDGRGPRVKKQRKI